MFCVKVPATTSNLGVGFDTLGMAINLYNEYTFETNDVFVLKGFSNTHKRNNLLQKTYCKTCIDYGVNEKDIQPLTITQVIQGIPEARGLGSSAACMVASVIAANHFHDLQLSKEAIARYVATLEGHPDNAFACVLGGLNATYLDDGTYYNLRLDVSKKLTFACVIPKDFGFTEALRNGLSKTVQLEDAVFHLSRMVQLPEAFKSGDLQALKRLLKDRLHEHFRSQFIKGYETIKDIATKEETIALISGSGPTMFFINETFDFSAFKQVIKGATLKEVTISCGVTWEVLK